MEDVDKIAEQLKLSGLESAEAILPLVYSQLRALAKHKLALEPAGGTLSGTALVHEAYLRVAGSRESNWDGSGHLYAAMAEAMRRILIDKARRRKAVKHGGELRREVFDSVMVPGVAESDEIFEVNESLDALEAEFPRKAQLVKFRYFVGMSTAEAAKVLNISLATAERDWAFAKTWLKVHIGER
jgi:RNA polymerase sigma factor (TIGR02999 family)